MSNDERAETQRLREANAVLMEALSELQNARFVISPSYKRSVVESSMQETMANVRRVAQAAIEKAKGVLSE